MTEERMRGDKKQWRGRLLAAAGLCAGALAIATAEAQSPGSPGLPAAAISRPISTPAMVVPNPSVASAASSPTARPPQPPPTPQELRERALRQQAQQEQRAADARVMSQIDQIQARLPGLDPAAFWRSLTERQKGILALDRLGFGADEATLRDIEAKGLAVWAREQSQPGVARVPLFEWQKISSMPELAGDPTQRAWDYIAREKAAKDATEDVKKALREEPQRWRKALFERQAILATRSDRPLQEAAVAFWQDHFSLFADKGETRLWLPAWDDNLRRRALGPFSELLASTATQPAMLDYLDNARSTGENSWIAERQRAAALKAGKPAPETGLNENYAREIMELHTLGVDGGYTQKDVRELARILTGSGIARSSDPQKMPPELAGHDVQQGAFFFDPRRHDFGEKQFLGRTIEGGGFSEEQEALRMLADSPKTAKKIAHEFAVRYIEDNPPNALTSRLAASFTRSGGRFSGLVEQALDEPDFWKGAIARAHARSPQERLWASLRIAYPAGGVTNWEPAWNLLRSESDLPWDHLTPEGYPRDSASWGGPEQEAQAAQIAQRMGDGNFPWFGPDRLLASAETMMAMAPKPASAPPPTDEEKAKRQALEKSWRKDPDAVAAFALAGPALSRQTLSAIHDAARNPREATGLLLASPEALGR